MPGTRTQSADRQLRPRTIQAVQTRAAYHSELAGDLPSTHNMAPPQPKTVHLPPFIAKDIKFWFLQVEALFRNGGITADQSKFDHVITALDVTAAADIRDVIEDPPEADMYETIKTKLIERLAISESTRIKDILSNQPMGDRKPSQHLRHLKAQAGAHFSEAALGSLWLETLPADVKLIVAGAKGLPLDQQAEMADNVMDVAGVRRLAAIQVDAGTAPARTADAQVASLAKQISALVQKLDSHASRLAAAGMPDGATRAKQKRSKSPAAPRAASPSPAGAPSAAGTGVCWYHRKFGDAATKCTKPCTWTPASGNAPAQS